MLRVHLRREHVKGTLEGPVMAILEGPDKGPLRERASLGHT